MKSTFLKTIFVLIAVFTTISIYAQEQKKAVEVEWDKKPIEEHRIDPVDILMKPRWIIPMLELNTNETWVKMGLANAGVEPVIMRIIFYNYIGKIEKIHEVTLDGKNCTYETFMYSDFKKYWFKGHVEMETTSLTAFFSAHRIILEDEGRKKYREAIQVFPIEFKKADNYKDG